MKWIVKSLVIVTAVVGCRVASYAGRTNILVVLDSYPKPIIVRAHFPNPEIQRLENELAHFADPQIGFLLKELEATLQCLELEKEAIEDCEHSLYRHKKKIAIPLLDPESRKQLISLKEQSLLEHQKQAKNHEKRCEELRNGIWERYKNEMCCLNRK